MGADAETYDELVAVLERIDSEIADEDLDRVGDELEELADVVDTLRSEERPLVARLQASQVEGDLEPDDYEFIATFQERITTAYLHRSGLLLGGDLLRFDPEQGEPEELRGAIDEMIENEKRIRDTTPEAASISEAVTLPPRIAILRFSVEPDPVPLGGELSVAVDVQNVGDEPMTDVTATVSSERLDRAESVTFDELDPNEREQISFTFEAAEAGTLDFVASVESEAAGRAKDSAEVTSESKGGLVREVDETVAGLRERTTETVDHDGTARSITSKLDAAATSLDRALEAIDAGRDTQANNSITTAMNQLGALLNTIRDDRSGRDSIPGQFRTVLERYAEGAIESLADARDARSVT